jgi:putative transposase
MTAWLRLKGYEVNRKRVQRLMRLMGIQGHLSQEKVEYIIYGREEIPFLIKGYGHYNT